MTYNKVNILDSAQTTSDYNTSRLDDKSWIDATENQNKKISTGHFGGVGKYMRQLPINIVLHHNSTIDENDADVKKVDEFLNLFLSILESEILNNRKLFENSGAFPSLYIKWLDDKSVLAEWVFKDFRIGFTFEPDIDDSGWYVVSNKNLEEYSASGLLTVNNLEGIIQKVLIFALSNS